MNFADIPLIKDKGKRDNIIVSLIAIYNVENINLLKNSLGDINSR